MTIEFERASEADKAYFCLLSETVYRALVERLTGEWDGKRELAKFEKKWQEQDFQKIYVNGELVGGFWVQEFESYDQLRELQIHPTFQNRGIGTYILKSLIDGSRKSGKEIRLRVLLNNPCVELYKRLGFKIIGKTEVQYHMSYST